MVIENNKLYGYNTDWIGVYKFFFNSGIKHINIIGYGGFGRAVAYALTKLNMTFSLLYIILFVTFRLFRTVYNIPMPINKLNQ